MNIFHHWYCNSKGWARSMHQYMPMMLGGVELGDNLLEVGPGPGVTTDWLREHVAHVTAVEIDSGLAKKLRDRTNGMNVTVVNEDATTMSLPDNTFSGAVSFTMLHHVPAAALQDKLLAEVCRVLRPGAPFAGSDSTPSLRWNLLHVLDTRVPCDPETFPQRLERAGFTDMSVRTYPGGFSFRAKKPSS